MKCCATCFGDRGLREELSYRSTEVATCDYCKTENQSVVDPSILLDVFELLTAIYEPNDQGRALAYWLKEDWALFSHPRMDVANTQRLLGDIFNDGELARRPFLPSEQFVSDRLEQWRSLRDELRYENRYFPTSQIELPRLEVLLTKLTLAPNEIPNAWYRARIQTGDAAFRTEEMKAPPAGLTSHGRANPAGIPYLYLGSQIDTVISEIRPHTGEVVCVAECATPDNLALVDLRHPRMTVSPFLLADEEEVGQMRFDLSFLEGLGEELTRPVRPQAAAVDYTPSQYLCEFIKKCGYDGVIYRSSVSEGINLALFKPEKATIGQVRQHSISRVVITYVDVEE
jgi:hypothetical protein